MSEIDFMAKAVRLASEGVERGDGGPFGAVIVLDGRIVGSACNTVLSSNDPTAHAEVEAIRDACRSLGNFSLAGCTLYTTCEPCPMCLAAIHWARLDEVVFAMTRQDAADLGFDDAAIRAAMEQAQTPMRRVAREDAAEVFAEWSEKTDRTQY